MIHSSKQSDQSSNKESSVYKKITISKEYDKESDKTEESEESEETDKDNSMDARYYNYYKVRDITTRYRDID